MNVVLKALKNVNNPVIVNTPVHSHDCDDCDFLGSVNHNDHIYDLYYHTNKKETYQTFVARYGNDEKYDSGMPFITTHPMLALAFVRKIVKDYSN